MHQKTSMPMETPTKNWTQKWWYEYLPPRMVYIGCQCSFMALIWNIGYLVHWFTTIVPIEVAYGHGASTASCSKPSNCAWSFQKYSVPWKIPQTKYHNISINPFLFHEKSHQYVWLRKFPTLWISGFSVFGSPVPYPAPSGWLAFAGASATPGPC